MVTAPSVVPDAPTLFDRPLLDALARIERLLLLDGDRWIVADETDPAFAKAPGLLDLVRQVARGRNHSLDQAERAKPRREIHECKAVAWAREYSVHEKMPPYLYESPSERKAMIGQRHPPYFADPKTGRVVRLKPLGRSQAIKTIDLGLKLIASAKFTNRQRIVPSDDRGTSDKRRSIGAL